MGNVTIHSRDGLQSLLSGLGDPMRDKAASASYVRAYRTDDDLCAAYETSWLAEKIIDIPADDATSEWRSWNASAEQITAIEATEKRLALQDKICHAFKIARLMGGAAIYIGTDQDPTTPFDPATVGRDGVKYLTVLTRREITAGDLEQDALSPCYGEPKTFTVNGSAGMVANIHPSRLVVLRGKRHMDPFIVNGPTRGWGRSVLDSIYDAVRNADGAVGNIAGLIFEANVDVLNIPDLMKNLADPEYEKRLTTRVMMAAAAKSTMRTLILDAKELHERKAVSFAQLPELMQQFLLMVSGAADIPYTRFMGQSATGMSATGEGDMDNYHKAVSSLQRLVLGPSMALLDEAILRASLGSRPPEIWHSWSPLDQLDEKEVAEIGEKIAKTSQTLGATGLFMPEELRTATANALTEAGAYPGLQDLVAETDARGDFDLGGDDEDEVDPDPDPTEPDPTQPGSTVDGIDDAAPRTLYVSRPVLNADEILGWAQAQGLTALYPAAALHVTVAYSRVAVDWMRIGEPYTDLVEVGRGGPRLVEVMGGGVVALLFKSVDLEVRHEGIHANSGAIWDWPEYQPHVTLAFSVPDGGLDSVEPYQGAIVLGPERFEPIVEDWRATNATVQNR